MNLPPLINDFAPSSSPKLDVLCADQNMRKLQHVVRKQWLRSEREGYVRNWSIFRVVEQTDGEPAARAICCALTKQRSKAVLRPLFKVVSAERKLGLLPQTCLKGILIGPPDTDAAVDWSRQFDSLFHSLHDVGLLDGLSRHKRLATFSRHFLDDHRRETEARSCSCLCLPLTLRLLPKLEGVSRQHNDLAPFKLGRRDGSSIQIRKMGKLHLEWEAIVVFLSCLLGVARITSVIIL